MRKILLIALWVFRVPKWFFELFECELDRENQKRANEGKPPIVYW